MNEKTKRKIRPCDSCGQPTEDACLCLDCLAKEEEQARRPKAHPDVVRSLKAEAFRTRGGHQPEVQEELGKLSNTTARWLLAALREAAAARSQQNNPYYPWGRR